MIDEGQLTIAETRRRIDDLVAELYRESAAMAAPGQGMAGPSSNTSSHPYPSVTDPYAAGVSGYGGSHPLGAYQGVSGPGPKVERIKQDLLHLQGELRRRLGDWDRDSQDRRHDAQRIGQVQNVSTQYHRAQDGAHKEKTQIVDLVNAISAAIHRAQQAIPLDAGHTGRPVRRTLDQVTGQGNDLYRGTTANNYGLPLLLQYLVPQLDKGRYGKVALQTTTEGPVPALRRVSSDRDETIWDKVVRGLGYLEKQNLRTYPVELPAYYYQMAPEGCVPASEYETCR